MVKLFGPFGRLGSAKVLAVGDFMLDTYTIGKVKRISPEAPVSILHVTREERRPGGAGNAILNLVSLGLEVVALGRVGGDKEGAALIECLKNEGVDVRGMFIQPGFKTPVKNRIIADNQQIVRVDYEENQVLPEMVEQYLIEQLPELLNGINVIAISDYAKGFLTRTLLAELIDQGKRKGIPIIIDPKGTDFSKYKGATVIKPNMREAIEASGLQPETSLEQVAAKLFHQVEVEAFFITRSEAGISLFLKDGERFDFPVRIREVKDVTGAGDTVLAMLTCAVANKLSLPDAAQLANIAAGIAIERFGCARISLSELAQRLLEENTLNKVFDENHLATLQEALKGKKCSLLILSGAVDFNAKSYSALRKAASESEGNLIVYVRDPELNTEMIDLLASLHEVHFVILKSSGIQAWFDKIKPVSTYKLENDYLISVDHQFI